LLPHAPLRASHTQSPTLFPYTTLFRSLRLHLEEARQRQPEGAERRRLQETPAMEHSPFPRSFSREPWRALCLKRSPRLAAKLLRSEEHTSELQSRENLVCRLLLEKKKE